MTTDTIEPFVLVDRASALFQIEGWLARYVRASVPNDRRRSARCSVRVPALCSLHPPDRGVLRDATRAFIVDASVNGVGLFSIEHVELGQTFFLQADHDGRRLIIRCQAVRCEQIMPDAFHLGAIYQLD